MSPDACLVGAECVRRVLHVTHSLQRIGEQVILGLMKTPTSNRTMVLPPACVTALERQIEPQALERHRNREKWQNQMNLVFTTEVCTPLNQIGRAHV